MVYKAKGLNLYEVSEEELVEAIISFRERTTPFLLDAPSFIDRPEIVKKLPPASRSSAVPGPTIPGPITLTAFSQACAGVLKALKEPDPKFSAEDVRYDSIFNELM